MIDPAFKLDDHRNAARQSIEARRLADTLSVLKLFLQRAKTGSAMSGQTDLTSALALIAALEALHRDLDRDAHGLFAISAAPALKGLCARISAALLEPLGLRCEALAEDGYMSGDDLALLRQVLPIILAGAARCASPAGREHVVHVRIRNSHQGWCCAVLHPGGAIGLDGEGFAAVEDLVDMAGGRLYRVQGAFGEGLLIRLGLFTDQGPPRPHFH